MAEPWPTGPVPNIKVNWHGTDHPWKFGLDWATGLRLVRILTLAFILATSLKFEFPALFFAEPWPTGLISEICVARYVPKTSWKFHQGRSKGLGGDALHTDGRPRDGRAPMRVPFVHATPRYFGHHECVFTIPQPPSLRSGGWLKKQNVHECGKNMFMWVWQKYVYVSHEKEYQYGNDFCNIPFNNVPLLWKEHTCYGEVKTSVCKGSSHCNYDKKEEQTHIEASVCSANSTATNKFYYIIGTLFALERNAKNTTVRS